MPFEIRSITLAHVTMCHLFCCLSSITLVVTLLHRIDSFSGFCFIQFEKTKNIQSSVSCVGDTGAIYYS